MGTQAKMSSRLGALAGTGSEDRHDRLVRPPAIPRAIPVPDRVLQQELPFASVAPHVYVHEGARQQLLGSLTQHLGSPVMLQITDNRQRMFTGRRAGPHWRVRLHHMFLDADQLVVRALADYLEKGDQASSTIIDRFIQASAHRIRKVPRRRKPILLEWQGRVHDLAQIRDRLDRRYFKGKLDVPITWGRHDAGRSRSSIKLGSYNPEYRLIRIHRALDQGWVPRFFVESVVYHEMCHALLHAMEGTEEGVRHSRRFARLEAGFKDHERAMAWQRKNLARLLRY